MAITPRSVSVGVFLSVLAVSLLAGCTSADPAPVATPEPVASEPAPQEPAVDAPEKPDDTLFTVSATVRATDGTSMSISLVGHSPLESTDPAAADLVDDFVEECVGQGGLSVSDVNTPVSTQSLAQFGSTLVQLEYSSTPEGHTFFAPVDLALGSPYFAAVASGKGLVQVTSNDTCTGHYQLTGSGAGTAIANFESGSTRADPGQWRFGHYGFTVPFESGATIEACKVIVSDLAAKSVAEVPGWELGSDATGISCGIGYRGE